MQHTLDCPPADLSEFECNPAFNVVIAYEDFEMGKEAKRTYDYLVDVLGSDCEFTNQMWKFDVLSIPKLREIATADALRADLIVISCHGDELPEPVKNWIDSWSGTASKCLALVALFDQSRGEASPARDVRDYLCHAARKTSMEFFAQPDAWPGGVCPQKASAFRAKDQRALSTLAGVVQRQVPVSRWGGLD